MTTFLVIAGCVVFLALLWLAFRGLNKRDPNRKVEGIRGPKPPNRMQ